jgi:hypothetical protein
LEKKFVDRAKTLAFNKQALEKGVDIARLNLKSE